MLEWLFHRGGNCVWDWVTYLLVIIELVPVVIWDWTSIWHRCAVQFLYLYPLRWKKITNRSTKEVVIKLLRHRSPESRVFNMLLKITNQQHVIIRMNYGVSYLTNTLGRFQVKERINSSYFHMCHHRIFNELIFWALKMMLVGTVSPVTMLGIIQCWNQELFSFICLPCHWKHVPLSLPSHCFLWPAHIKW